MQPNQLSLGQKVYFGRPSGEKTLGEIVKLNPTRAKVKTLTGRGSHRQSGTVWSVPYSLLSPAEPAQSPQPGLAVTDLVLTMASKVEDGKRWHGDDKYAERRDHYFAGTVAVNGRAIPIKVHLMTCDGSIRGTEGQWHVSAELNGHLERYTPAGKSLVKCCNLCCDWDGGPTGETAIAVAPVVFPWLKRQGYVLSETSTPGGWWSFECYGAVVGKETHERRGRRHVWRCQIDCPVHGVVEAHTWEMDGD